MTPSRGLCARCLVHSSLPGACNCDAALRSVEVILTVNLIKCKSILGATPGRFWTALHSVLKRSSLFSSRRRFEQRGFLRLETRDQVRSRMRAAAWTQVAREVEASRHGALLRPASFILPPQVEC